MRIITALRIRIDTSTGCYSTRLVVCISMQWLETFTIERTTAQALSIFITFSAPIYYTTVTNYSLSMGTVCLAAVTMISGSLKLTQ